MSPRNAAADQIRVFRQILTGAGLEPRPWKPAPLILGVAGGLVAATGLFGPRLLASVGATASISMSPTLSGHTVTVTASTDLPEGAIVSVLVVQRDQYDAAISQGADPNADSPWVHATYVRVLGGSFSASFDVTGWPAGRPYAAAEFWMQPAQPLAAIDRFGARGERLKGPDVVSSSDGEPELQVATDFTIP